MQKKTLQLKITKKEYNYIYIHIEIYIQIYIPILYVTKNDSK